MSFYNLVHGENPMAHILLGLLGLTRGDVPRYRDCYWTGEYICVHTRTGGGNRESYQDGNDGLVMLPTYVRDEDDDFDSTYANFYFTVPETFAWAIPQLQAADATPQQKWESFFSKLQASDKNDPQVAKVLTAMGPVMQQISEALKQE